MSTTDRLYSYHRRPLIILFISLLATDATVLRAHYQTISSVKKKFKILTMNLNIFSQDLIFFFWMEEVQIFS